MNGGHIYNASPLYIGYSDEQQTRKDNIYFKNLSSPKSSGEGTRTPLPAEDSLDEFQKRLDRSVIGRLNPASRERDFPMNNI